MDVVRLILLLFAFSSVACVKQSPKEVMQKQEAICPQQVIKNQFLVRWNDGHLSTENFENKEIFLEKFVKPNSDKIKAVEYNTILTLGSDVPTTPVTILVQET